MGLNVTVVPATEPITTAEAKAHLRVDDSTDDTTIDSFVSACRGYLEDMLNRTLVSTTYEWTRDGFPPSHREVWNSSSFRGMETFYVPRSPLISVTSIQYIDQDGVTQTLASSKYTVDTGSEPGRIYPTIDEFWPDTRSVNNSVTVTYVAGYGDLTAVPKKLKQLLMLLLGAWYENRENVITNTRFDTLPFGVETLIANHRIEDHSLEEDFNY